MRKLLIIGLIILVVALTLTACATKEIPVQEKKEIPLEDSVGDEVLDNIADTPEEVVDEELDEMMDDIAMDDW